MPNFNVLIATIGKPELQQMLDSLSPQLDTHDCVTIVFDGHLEIPSFNFDNFKCPVKLFNEPVALGYWGHGIRNKYAPLLENRDFIMHADDDDIYTDFAFSKLRQECADNTILYIGQMQRVGIRKYLVILPTIQQIKVGQVGTPMGIIPYKLNTEGTWSLYHGGDGEFYMQISKNIPVVFLDILIYIVKPSSPFLVREHP